MKVLYDVGNLGLSFGTGLTRTGIFRTTEAFAREILRRPDVDARFAALEAFSSQLQLARYFRSLAVPPDNFLSAWDSPLTDPPSAIQLVDRLLELGEGNPEGRRLMAELQLIDHSARAETPAGRFEIYHSLRAPLASAGRVDARARVLTIHDMIPSLFPELCEERFVVHSGQVLASIDLERDWIVTNSEHTKCDFCELTSMERDRVFVTPLAAAPEIFRPEPDPDRVRGTLERYGIPPGDYILSLCTLEPRKNLPRLVRAFFALLGESDLTQLRLLLVGPLGWKSDSLIEAVEERPELRERIVLPGYVDDADLSAIYSGARVFVYPSLYEGFGLPVLEAMQCGVPVVTSANSSLPEVVGDAAIAVDPADGDALAQTMLTVLRDPALAAELGRRGLARSRRFSWPLTVDRTLRAYATMLGHT